MVFDGISRESQGLVGINRDSQGLEEIRRDSQGFIGICWDSLGFDGIQWYWSVLGDLDYHRTLQNTQSYKWVDLIGWIGWKSPGGRRYRAPYGANKFELVTLLLNESRLFDTKNCPNNFLIK